MEDMFDLELIESAFGGKDDTSFDISKYAERMKEDDEKMSAFWMKGSAPAQSPVPASTNSSFSNPVISESDSETSEGKPVDDSSSRDASLEELDKAVEDLSLQKVDEEEKSPDKLPGITVSN